MGIVVLTLFAASIVVGLVVSIAEVSTRPMCRCHRRISLAQRQATTNQLMCYYCPVCGRVVKDFRGMKSDFRDWSMF